jgi:hypothetical protein
MMPGHKRLFCSSTILLAVRSAVRSSATTVFARSIPFFILALFCLTWLCSLLPASGVPVTPKHCDDPHVFDGGTFQLDSMDFGVTWSSKLKPVAPPLTPNPGKPNANCVIPTMGNGMQMSGGPFSGRLILPLVHDGYNGGVVISSDDGGQSYNLSTGLHIPGIDETQIAQLPNGSLMSISRNCFTPTTLPPAVATCNYDRQADTDGTDEMALYKPGSRFVWSTSPDGGVTWTTPQIHPDLPSPGCKGSLISYQNSVYWAGPYSTSRRHNLTVLASDDNGQHFNRSLQITPPAPLNLTDPSAYPVPGAGYSQLQCGLPMPLDCAIVSTNEPDDDHPVS